ncbi:Hypothetical protein CINCED_3A015916 [Cinara cedri]|uniref:Uncharacterized protein n=2 Tax=Cinara cedri TaxID=506608 RepID=A0A5E4N198_9HEMI|nr:Hypothetical protein CINCED_3A015916 [Cinara cedri]
MWLATSGLELFQIQLVLHLDDQMVYLKLFVVKNMKKIVLSGITQLLAVGR